MDKDVDLCSSGLTILEDRSRVIDFVSGVLEQVASISVVNPSSLLVGPKANPMDVTGYITILTGKAWVALLAVGAASIGVFVFINTVLETEPAPLVLRVGHNFLGGAYELYLSLMLKNDDSKLHHLPMSLSPKIFWLTQSVLTFMFFTLYTSDLTAQMTTGPPEMKLRNFRDVMDSEYTVYVRRGSALHGFFENANPTTDMHKVFRAQVKLYDGSVLQDLQSSTEDPRSTILHYGSSLSRSRGDGFRYKV